MDRFTVPRSYAEDVMPLLEKAKLLSDFTEAHPAESTSIQSHADYNRLQTAVKNAQELSKVAAAKLEKFKQSSIEERARTEQRERERDETAERIRANRAADQARRDAAARRSGPTTRPLPQPTPSVQRRYNSTRHYWERWDETLQQWVYDSTR